MKLATTTSFVPQAATARSSAAATPVAEPAAAIDTVDSLAKSTQAEPKRAKLSDILGDAAKGAAFLGLTALAGTASSEIATVGLGAATVVSGVAVCKTLPIEGALLYPILFGAGAIGGLMASSVSAGIGSWAGMPGVVAMAGLGAALGATLRTQNPDGYSF